METKHTPEPWGIDPAIHPNNQVFSESGIVVADCKWTNYEPQVREANASRIVACVNACAGLTEAELGKFIDVRDALKASNLELAEALKALAEKCEQSDDFHIRKGHQMAKARAALAKLQP